MTFKSSIIATCRYHFERQFNAGTNQEEGGEVSFPDFVDVLLNGHVDYANFLEENHLDGESVAVNTGMIDGETGLSQSWNSYWRHCGLCNPDFSPQYILHLSHFKKDAQVRTK